MSATTYDVCNVQLQSNRSFSRHCNENNAREPCCLCSLCFCRIYRYVICRWIQICYIPERFYLWKVLDFILTDSVTADCEPEPAGTANTNSALMASGGLPGPPHICSALFLWQPSTESHFRSVTRKWPAVWRRIVTSAYNLSLHYAL